MYRGPSRDAAPCRSRARRPWPDRLDGLRSCLPCAGRSRRGAARDPPRAGAGSCCSRLIVSIAHLPESSKKLWRPARGARPRVARLPRDEAVEGPMAARRRRARTSARDPGRRIAGRRGTSCRVSREWPLLESGGSAGGGTSIVPQPDEAHCHLFKSHMLVSRARRVHHPSLPWIVARGIYRPGVEIDGISAPDSARPCPAVSLDEGLGAC